ncbi:unnamed protein product [Anisakis simplex]|uniref:BAR domain-containing protein n=1 Tax=Anisakis simplex TaxID=6269 RepID=A0A0M3IZG8_ANISI|nr:unnamed protein product [Anisakis simplex]
MVTKNVRDEMQKIREQISGEFNKHNKELLLEIQQTQVKLMEAQRDLQRQLAVMRGQYEDLRRPKLRAFTTDGDQLEALLSTCNFPQLLPISNMIKAMKRSSPGFIRLLGYPSHSPLLWFCVISR